jgi:hypothetical protein
MKIGFDQIGVPAPVFYQRLVTAMVVFIMPSLMATVQGMPGINDKWRSFIMLIIAFVASLFKAGEFILGDGNKNEKATN